MKQCIWCRQFSPAVSFNSKAHIVPKGLGGTHIWESVCDVCNRYFGAKTNKAPAVEETLKETFHITRLRFLYADGPVGKNKPISKPDFVYFKIDLRKPKLSLKNTYKLKPYFEEKLCRQLKKGLFKMFLEESERQFCNGLDPKFDFIREFARYDLGDYPVLYFTRKIPIILQHVDHPASPELYLRPDQRSQYLLADFGFHEFEFLSHVFAIPTTRYWRLTWDKYRKETTDLKKKFFISYKPIAKFQDIDFTLSIFDRK